MTQHHFVGNLAADPEYRTTEGGVANVRLRLACSERYFDSKSRTWKSKEAVFWDAYAWKARAEGIAAQGWRKGQAVVLVGEFTVSTWEDASGARHTRTYITIEAAGPNVAIHRKGAPGTSSRSAVEDAAAVPQPVPGALPGTGPVDAEAEAGL